MAYADDENRDDQCRINIYSGLLVVLVLTILVVSKVSAKEPTDESATKISICKMPDSEIVGRIGTETISAGDLKSQVKDVIKRNQINVRNSADLDPHRFIDSVVPARTKEPAKEEYSEDEIYESVCTELLKRDVEEKLIFNDAHQTIPAQAWAKIQNDIYHKFDIDQLPELLKLYEAQDQDALDQKLSDCGDSLNRIRRRYFERQLALGWMNEKIKLQGPPTEDNTSKRQRVKQEIDDYLSELRKTTTVWTIFDSEPDAEPLPTESIQIFPRTYREDFTGNSRLPKIIP